MKGGRVAAPFDVIRAAHAELLVAELERSRAFYVDQLGMVVTEEDKNTIYLRGYEDRHHHCLVLRRAPVAAVGHLAFLVASDRDLKRAAAHYQALGRPVRLIEDGEEAGQGRAIRTQDPVGFPLEFFSQMAKARS